MILRLTYVEAVEDLIEVTVNVGDRTGDGKHAAYETAEAGTLTLSPPAWDAFRETLSRGVKQPNVLLIEKG